MRRLNNNVSPKTLAWYFLQTKLTDTRPRLVTAGMKTQSDLVKIFKSSGNIELFKVIFKEIFEQRRNAAEWKSFIISNSFFKVISVTATHQMVRRTLKRLFSFFTNTRSLKAKHSLDSQFVIIWPPPTAPIESTLRFSLFFFRSLFLDARKL